MTTRTGEPATKRESYTTYLQGRAATVRSNPTHNPLPSLSKTQILAIKSRGGKKYKSFA